MKVTLLSHVFGPNMGGGAVPRLPSWPKGCGHATSTCTVIATHDGPSEYDHDAGRYSRSIPCRPAICTGWRTRTPFAARQSRLAVSRLPGIPGLWAGTSGYWPREAPDIVHVHKMRGLSPAVWSAAAAAGCRPIVQTCRDYEAMSPEGTLTGRHRPSGGNGALGATTLSGVSRPSLQHDGHGNCPSQYTLNTVDRSEGSFRRRSGWSCPTPTA